MGNSFTVSDAGVYYVKAKNGCGEKLSGNFDVMISSPPTGATLASNPSDGALCKDMSVLLAPISLLGGPPSRLEYYKGDQLVYATNFPFTNGLAYHATQTGTYKVKIINKCGSFMTNTKDVIANNGATSASLDLTGVSPSLGCGVTEITVGVKANGTVDGYNWIIDGGASGDANPTLTITAEGEYYAEVFSVCGVYYTDTINVVTVSAPPLSNINLSSAGGLTTCEGKITLTCTDAGAGSAYKWFKDGVLYTTNAKNSLEATESGTYTVQATNACGNSNLSNAIALTVKKKANKPTITAPTGSDFCGATGSVLLLMDSPVEVGIEYQWLKNGSPIAGANNMSYEATESAIYTLRALNPTNDCPAEVSEPIQVRFIVAPILANLFIQMNVCESPLVLRAISSGNFLQYRWFLLNGTTNPEVGNADTFMPTTSGVYAVSVRNDCLPAGLWLTSQSVTATVSSTGGGAIPIPEIVSEPLGIDRICPETSLKLKAQTSTSLPNPAYRWFLGDDMITGATSGEIMVSNSGLYRVEIYSPQNPTCGQISSAYSIFVRPVPTLLLSYNPSLTFCEGDSIRLNANAQQVPSLYAWSLGGTALQNGNVLYAKVGGEYTIKGVYNAGTLSFPCDYETTRTIETTRLPAPVPEIVLKGGLLESKNKAESYQWNYEGVPVLGANNPFYMPVDSGRYTLTVTNDLGCSGTSNFVRHKGIYDHTPPLEIAPNPNQGTFRVTVVGKEEVAMVEVYNAQGQLVSASSPALRVNSLASHTEITFRGLARGVYLVRATIGGKEYAKRVLVL
ncbi:MAG: T9SS C-terminal target domain-containing protein [Bacteroidetes bacterium]|nr:MAG: T9SS C-terminal target domain-containing protein [Bacteroidota bacterium]